MTETKHTPDWEADCGVCGFTYGWAKEEAPPAGGVFCPNCRDEKRRCIGVLNFEDRAAIAKATGA